MAKRRKQPKAAGSSNSSGKGLLVVAALALGAYWLYSSKTEQSHASRSATPIEQSKTVNQTQEIALIEASDKARSIQQQQRQQTLRARAFSDLSQQLDVMKLAVGNENPVRIPIRLVSGLQGCQMGDLDLLNATGSAAKRARVLVTLEGVGGGASVDKQLKVVTPQAFIKGENLEFQVDRDDFKQGIGLYVCLDTKGQTSCAAKKAYDATELSEAVFAKRGAVKMDQDPIFYYQLLMFDGKSINIPSSADTTRQHYKKFVKYAQKFYPDDGDRKRVLSSTRQLHDRLMPVPASIKHKRIVVNLPRSDDKCFSSR